MSKSLRERMGWGGDWYDIRRQAFGIPKDRRFLISNIYAPRAGHPYIVNRGMWNIPRPSRTLRIRKTMSREDYIKEWEKELEKKKASMRKH